jgi:type III restriction enzyme
VLERIDDEIKYDFGKSEETKKLIIEEAKKIYEETVSDIISNVIEIPRIIIAQCNEVTAGFYDFELDCRNLNFQPGYEEIKRKNLTDGREDIIYSNDVKVINDLPENILVNELIDEKYPEVDYEEHCDMLYKLSKQALQKFRSYLNEKQVENLIKFQKKQIAEFIYAQMQEHFFCEIPKYEKPIIYPFTKIKEHNLSKVKDEAVVDFRETISTDDITKKVFCGFKKACHTKYKFDSKTEKDFTMILESSDDVLKWLKPAHNQFNIMWDRNRRQYIPDFIAETPNSIHMIETKMAKELFTDEVNQKKIAGVEYCTAATEFTNRNGGKPWRYILIPHDRVILSASFVTLANEYLVELIKTR